MQCEINTLTTFLVLAYTTSLLPLLHHCSTKFEFLNILCIFLKLKTSLVAGMELVLSNWTMLYCVFMVSLKVALCCLVKHLVCNRIARKAGAHVRIETVESGGRFKNSNWISNFGGLTCQSCTCSVRCVVVEDSGLILTAWGSLHAPKTLHTGVFVVHLHLKNGPHSQD